MSDISFFLEPPPLPDNPWAAPIEDINMSNARYFYENRQFDFFKRLRDEDPVHACELEVSGRYWDVTRFEDILYVDKNHQLFSSAHGITLGRKVDARILYEDNLAASDQFIAMDPPKHDLQRAAVSRATSPPNLASLSQLIRERAARILDSLPFGETFDWVEKVSRELTTQMLATLFDFPFEDRRKLSRWSDVITALPGLDITAEEQQQELKECLEYFTRLWNERATKKPGNDLISMLAHSENTKDMPPLELLGNLKLLIVGGNDTTRNSISGGVIALNENPAEYDKLRADQSLIPNMVSEIIRWQTPLPYMRRTAMADTELHGKQIKAGEQVLMWYISGNRDEREIDRPDEFLIDRPNPRHHLSFGFGIHRCMGNRLAEMQLKILWEEVMQRFSFIEMKGEPTRLMSCFVRGVSHLPVEVHPL